MSKRRRIIIIALAVAAVGFIVYLIASGGVTPASRDDSSAETSTTVPESILEEQPSLIEQKTGIDTPPSEAYVPTGEDVKSIVTPLIAFDTTTQTYDQWQENAKKRIAFSPQDFPEDSIRGITPSRERWEEGWKREFVPSIATPLGSYKGQGGVRIYDWNVSGFQTLYDPEGNPFTGAQNDITLSIACGGPSVDDCFLYTYFGVWPLQFEEESTL